MGMPRLRKSTARPSFLTRRIEEEREPDSLWRWRRLRDLMTWSRTFWSNWAGLVEQLGFFSQGSRPLLLIVVSCLFFVRFVFRSLYEFANNRCFCSFFFFFWRVWLVCSGFLGWFGELRVDLWWGLGLATGGVGRFWWFLWNGFLLKGRIRFFWKGKMRDSSGFGNFGEDFGEFGRVLAIFWISSTDWMLWLGLVDLLLSLSNFE